MAESQRVLPTTTQQQQQYQYQHQFQAPNTDIHQAPKMLQGQSSATAMLHQSRSPSQTLNHNQRQAQALPQPSQLLQQQFANSMHPGSQSLTIPSRNNPTQVHNPNSLSGSSHRTNTQLQQLHQSVDFASIQQQQHPSQYNISSRHDVNQSATQARFYQQPENKHQPQHQVSQNASHLSQLSQLKQKYQSPRQSASTMQQQQQQMNLMSQGRTARIISSNEPVQALPHQKNLFTHKVSESTNFERTRTQEVGPPQPHSHQHGSSIVNIQTEHPPIIVQKEFTTRAIKTYKEMKQRITQLQLANQAQQSFSQQPHSEQQTLHQQPISKQQKYSTSLAAVGQLSYNQILKKEWPQGYNKQPIGQGTQNQTQIQASNIPGDQLKQTLQQQVSEILRKVLARSESIGQLRQMIDLRNRRVKNKNYESQVFLTILEKEQQRIQQENILIAKQTLKIDDKSLIKNLQKMVKKMLKPFKGLQFDEFLHNEIHLNEIMTREDDQVDPMKESRKRHLRILDAALKEQVVDTQLTLGICVQISRQAFFNELMEYYVCAHEYISANQKDFQSQDVQLIFGMKQRIQKMKPQLKVQLQQNKKMDKMFWLLLEQNQDVKHQIQNYKEVYEKTTQQKAQRVNYHHTANQESSGMSSSFNVRSSSNTGLSTQNQSQPGQSSSRQSAHETQSNQSSISKGFRLQQALNQQPQIQIKDVQAPRRRVGSRTNQSQVASEIFQSQRNDRDSSSQNVNHKTQPSIEQSSAAADQEPRQLASQRQQRVLDALNKNSIDVNFELQSTVKKQGQQKILQPLVLKAPKTQAISSLKAKQMQEQLQQQSSHNVEVIQTKKKRTLKSKRQILEPLTDQKIHQNELRKTDSNFCVPTSPSQLRNRLNPLGEMQQINRDDEEVCECTVPKIVANMKEERKSAEFKMRIVTKRRSQLKQPTRLVCEHCGGTIQHALHGSYSQTSVKKRQQSEFSSNQEDAPSFNIDMARVGVGLNFGQNSGAEDGEIAYGGNTERLLVVPGVQQNGYGDSSARSDQTLSEKQPFSVYDMLNVRYMTQIRCNDPFCQEFVITHRINRIQKFYKARHAKRVAAVRLICKGAKVYLSQRGNREMQRGRIHFQKVQFAINRIAELYHSLKVKKVGASMLINSKEFYDRVQQILHAPNAVQIIKAVTALQRRWRIKYQSKFQKGRLLMKNHALKKQLWKQTMSKYRTTRNDESECLNNEVHFLRESQNLERYFWRQQVAYIQELETRSQMIAFKTLKDFNIAEWTFNSESREWTSKSGVLVFALEKNESNAQQVLKDKVVQFYISSQNPTSQFISMQLQHFVDSKAAMQALFERERRVLQDKTGQMTKKKRLQKLGLL